MLGGITQSSNYKWWAFGTIAIGTFMSVVDHGSVVVALPRIESHFRSDLPTVQWVVVGHALMISVLLLPMGRLADIMGRKQVYISGFVIFVLAAALAGFSTHLSMLIFAKVVQGAGSAMIQANGMAIIASVFPGSERGKALGSHLSVVGTGLIAGPALGGLLVSALDWRWVFFVNVPVGIVAIAIAIKILGQRRFAQDPREGGGSRFDLLGAALSGGALLAFLLAITNGNRASWGSAPIVAGLLLSAALLAAFVWWELRTPSPMLELRLFRRRLFALGVAAGWLSFLGTSSVLFMMPFYLQKVLGYSVWEAGLVVIPGAICMTIMGPISGRLSDRFGWRRFNVAGLALSATALFILSTRLTETSSLGLVIPVLMLLSCGTGIFQSPNHSSILSAVERSRYGVVSAVTQLVRNSANVTSIALATAVVVATMASMGFEPSLDAVSVEGGSEVAHAFVSGLHRAFMVFGSILVLGMVISFVKGERAEGVPASTPRSAVGESQADG